MTRDEAAPLYQQPLDPGADAGAGSAHQLRFTLTQPESLIRVRDPQGRLGHAAAAFRQGIEDRNWGAKHSWAEGEGPERVRVYEFDEALPAGEIRLRVETR